MFFFGDIALPHDFKIPATYYSNIFKDNIGVANLEGDIVGKEEISSNSRAIYNSHNIIDYLRSINIKVVSIANNHILDLHTTTRKTVNKLYSEEILHCGAGETLSDAARPVVLKHDDRQYLFLAFGWEVINCKVAGTGRPGVNPFRPKNVLESVRMSKQKYPEAVIILLFHWNYELELYPQPMHRQLAFAAIDAGADAIIGSHSHRVQGIEFYKNAPVVYSLGNWLFPQGVFSNGKVRYPPESRVQMAFQWKPETRQATAHWFEYTDAPSHELRYLESNPVPGCRRVKELTPFNNYQHEEYIGWFRKHRVKRLLLPVYKDMRSHSVNALKDMWVRLRDKVIGVLVTTGIKNYLNSWRIN